MAPQLTELPHERMNAQQEEQLRSVKAKLQADLTIAAVYFYDTHGIPLEVFNNWLEDMSLLDQAIWIVFFKREHPHLYAGALDQRVDQ